MDSLKIITSTTREGRKGGAVAEWITTFAKEQATFNVELLDLAEIDLPFLNEPNHPRLQQYKYEHTKSWSEMISSADAFIIVLSEYNHGYPAPIKNAIDYLHNEWKNKPVAFVSYGGISAGLRSSQMLKPVVTALGMMPVPEQVNLPFFARSINDDEVFVASDIVIQSATVMLNELQRWSAAMKPLRTQR